MSGDTRAASRAPGRAALGFGAATSDERRVRPVAIGAGLCAVAAPAGGLALFLLSHGVGRTIGVTSGGVAFARVAGIMAILAAAPVLAALVLRSRSRRGTAIAGSTVATVGVATASSASGLGALAGGAALGGVGVGAAAATHLPLVVDAAPPAVWGAAVATYRTVVTAGMALTAALVTASSGLNLTWRSTLLVVAGLGATATALGGLLLRDRAPADEAALRDALVPDHDLAALGEARGVAFGAAARAALAVPATRRALSATATLAAFEFPLLAITARYLAEYWSLPASQQSAAIAVLLGVAAAGLAFAAGPTAATWRAGPVELTRSATRLVAVGGVALVVAAVSPVLVLALVALAVAYTALALVHVAVDVALVGAVPARLRPVVTALAAVTAAAGGSLGLYAVVRSIETRAGAAWGLGILGLIAVALRATVKALGSETDRAVDARIDAVLEEARVAVARRDGTDALLACRGIDFAYGHVQVLFDVDFSVGAGEMVALLGTNGAGKSTLLRAIAGVGAPSSGTVRFDGVDITSLTPAARVELGIVQVPGGRAAFGQMTVMENLRLNAYSLGRDRARVNDAIERAFADFPRLAERRTQSAATLSGGERQMLALSKAVMTEPRVLLIDELSLGLAPAVVAELLERVREINRRGAAVVLVEQSVNVALSLVDHAYFMEKGEVRFDGRSADLLKRPDVLRSVFLKGAAKGLRTG